MDALIPDLRPATTAVDQAQLARARRDLGAVTQRETPADPNAKPDNDLVVLRQVA